MLRDCDGDADALPAAEGDHRVAGVGNTALRIGVSDLRACGHRRPEIGDVFGHIGTCAVRAERTVRIGVEALVSDLPACGHLEGGGLVRLHGVRFVRPAEARVRDVGAEGEALAADRAGALVALDDLGRDHSRDEIVNGDVLRIAVGSGESCDEGDLAAEIADVHAGVHPGESVAARAVRAVLGEGDISHAVDLDGDGGDVLHLRAELGKVKVERIDVGLRPFPFLDDLAIRGEGAIEHSGVRVAHDVPRGDADERDGAALRAERLDFVAIFVLLTGERRKRNARAELAADIAVADGTEVGPGDLRLLDDRVACRDDVRLHREVEIGVDDDGAVRLGVSLECGVDVVGGAGGVCLEGIEDELVNLTLANGLPMFREVLRTLSVALAFGVALEVGGVIGSGIVARIHEGEALDPAAHDVDGHGHRALETAFPACMDLHGGASYAAVVVVADAGVVPGEFALLEGVLRRIDVGVFALRIVGAVRVVAIDLAGGAVRPGFALELDIARSGHALCLVDVTIECAHGDEHAVDVDGDAVVELLLAVVHAEGSGQEIVAHIHIFIRREVLTHVVEVAVGDVGEHVGARDAQRREHELERAVQRARAPLRGGGGGLVAVLGSRDTRESEGISRDIAVRERDLQLGLLAKDGISVIGIGVHHRDAGGQVGIAGVEHFDDLSVRDIAAHRLREASGLAHELEALAEQHFRLLDDARVDDDGHHRLIEVAVRVLEGGDVVGVSRTRERESRVGGELVAPAHDGDLLRAVRKFHLERTALDMFGLPGLLIDHLVVRQRGTPGAFDEVGESAVDERVDGHGAELGLDDGDRDGFRLGSRVDVACRVLHIRVVREGDDDIGVDAVAAARDGEACHVERGVGVIGKAVPVERRALGGAVGVHHGAALGHRAVELLCGGDLIGLHSALERGRAAVGEGVGVRSVGCHVVSAGDGGRRPLEVTLLTDGDGDGDGLCDIQDKASVVGEGAREPVCRIHDVIRGDGHPFAVDLDDEVIAEAADELPVFRNEIGLLEFHPDIPLAADIHRDIDAECAARAALRRLHERGDIPVDNGELALEDVAADIGAGDLGGVVFEVSFNALEAADQRLEVTPAVVCDLRAVHGQGGIVVIVVAVFHQP